MLKSKWTRGIRRAFFVFALVFAVRPVVHAQTYAEVTAESGGSYELEDLALPDNPPIAAGLQSPFLNLSDVTSATYPHSNESGRMANSGAETFVQTQHETPADKNLKWRVANQESLLFTGIMHTFNIWTEAGTRDTLDGHWLQHYLQSVSELRGWSDSDRFMSPYVGHTIEGAIFGYIERQNDPKYHAVQWGDGREYFISLLRSLTYSAIWHTQWKIGPMSEASIGNVMLHASPGFITLTDTPTLGTIAMIGEDAADRYVIMGLENRTTNPPLVALARSFLNPGRSFANVMAFRVPWHRDTRIGLFGRNHQVRKELIAAYHETGEKAFEYVRPPRTESSAGSYPKEASIELSAFPVFQNFLGGGSCIGGGGSGAGRINPSWQFVAELSGCLVMHMPSSDQSGDSLFYGGGVRWTPRASRSVSPYLQLMMGGNKVTHETDNIPLRERLLAEWNDGNGTLPHYPMRSAWSVEGWNVSGGSSMHAISRAASVALWAFMGIESAAVSAGVIEDPKRNIPLATLFGLAISTVIYVLSCTVIMGIVPNAQLRSSHAPFAEAARLAVGTTGMVIIGVCAILKSLGALGGWMLLVGQSAKAAADDGMFPSVFGRMNRYGVPGVGLAIVSVLMTIALFATVSPTIAGQFDRIISLTVILIVIPYVYASVAVVKVVYDRVGRGRTFTFFKFVALAAVGYCLWAVVGGDPRTIMGSLVALLVSVPLYPFFIRTMEAAARRKQELHLAADGSVQD